MWSSVRGVALALGAFASLAFGSRPARACAACGCGDPTLTAAGTEQPFAGRLRTSLELRYRSDSIGEPGVDEMKIREGRADLGLAWAPIEALFVLATVPFLYREVSDPSLAEHRAWGLGDIEARAKLFFYRDRAFAPRHLIAGVVGLKVPTAMRQEGPRGGDLPLEAQPGAGAWALLVGPTYALFVQPFSLYAGAELSVPLATRDDAEPGLSLRSTLALQYQALSWLALRPAAESRWDARTREGGEVDPNSGGVVVFAGGDVLVSPAEDWTVALGARAPVIQALNGHHREGWSFALALTRDW